MSTLSRQKRNVKSQTFSYISCIWSEDEITIGVLSIGKKTEIFRGNQSGDRGLLSEADCIVLYNGEVMCVPTKKHDALCRPDLTKYPFDVQNCTLRYGFWVYSGQEVNYTLSEPPVSLDDFTPNSEWELVDVSTEVDVSRFRCCPNETYPTLSYSFRISRRSGTHVATIFVPALGIWS